MDSIVSVEAERGVRQEVRDFYDSVGWQDVGEGLYQNARYEDLRPVSREYTARCHRRVGRTLPLSGRLLLDAGSGPIQYPEYLEFSRGFSRRVCLDISGKALAEARGRIGNHGLFVVGDVSQLPFVEDAFDAVVSMHTIHHVPATLQVRAFDELFRVQRAGSRAVVVNTWGGFSLLMRLIEWPMRFVMFARTGIARVRGRSWQPGSNSVSGRANPSKTYTHHLSPKDTARALSHLPDLEVRVWRSVSPGFTRAFIDPRFFGRKLLRFIYWTEERAPHLLGRWGQYPMIIYGKPSGGGNAVG